MSENKRSAKKGVFSQNQLLIKKITQELQISVLLNLGQKLFPRIPDKIMLKKLIKP